MKIAYATSFGKDKYIGPEDEKIRTDRNLHRFDGISVRDDFSQRICKDEFGISAELLSDPVFYAQLRNIMNSLQRHRILKLRETTYLHIYWIQMKKLEQVFRK